MIEIDKKIYFSFSVNNYFCLDSIQESIYEITKEEYCEIIFGIYNFNLYKLLGYSYCITPNKIIAAFYQQNDLKIFDRKGVLIEVKKDFFEGFTPYQIQLDDSMENLWIATGAGQVVLCKNINTGATIFELGIPYEEYSPLSFPEEINRVENELYIAEMGNRCVSVLDLITKKRTIYSKFNEPVWGFSKFSTHEIIQLDSGVYYRRSNSKIDLHKIVT